MNEIDFRKELASPPLTRNGFTEQLRNRIEQKIDGKTGWARWRLPVAGGVCLVLILAVSIPLLVSRFAGEPVGISANLAMDSGGSAGADLRGSSEGPAPSEAQPFRLKSALLIGLRTDRTDKDSRRHLDATNSSAYRTLLIAPERGRLVEAAEGSGVLVPYGQKFWKVETLSNETPSDVIRYLVAHPAEQPASPHSYADRPDVEMNHEEKLLFAGNQYISMSESEKTWDGNRMLEYDRVHVRTLPQVTDANRFDFSIQRPDEGYVSLQDIFGDVTAEWAEPDDVQGGKLSAAPTRAASLANDRNEYWTIARSRGQWVPQVALETEKPERGGQSFTLRNVALPLPESVVSHDSLCCSWQSIKKLEPEAVDAVSSPVNDVIAILTPDQIRVYEIGGSSEPLLVIDLMENEKLIMAQWATDPYIDLWITEAGKFLSES